MWSSVGPLVSLECLYNPTELISAVTARRKALHLKKTPSFQLCGKVSWERRWRMTISPLLKLHCCTATARKLVYSMKASSRCVCGSICVFALDHICNMYRSQSHAIVVGSFVCFGWVKLSPVLPEVIFLPAMLSVFDALGQRSLTTAFPSENSFFCLCLMHSYIYMYICSTSLHLFDQIYS